MFDKHTQQVHVHPGSSDSGGMQVLGMLVVGGGIVIAGVIGFGMAMAAIASMIWAIVTLVLGLAFILAGAWGAVQFRRAKADEVKSVNYRAAEDLARLLALAKDQGQVQDISSLPQVIDARQALPAAQPIMVNGVPYKAARR